MKRRRFLITVIAYISVLFGPFRFISMRLNHKHAHANQTAAKTPFVGEKADGPSDTPPKTDVYMASGRSPKDNMAILVDRLGGIQSIVGNDDIVVLKVNAQRFNQGMTNTDLLKAFIDLVLSSNNFSGEIIVADNHQYKEDNCCGWTTDKRNGQFNFNELIDHYQKLGFKNVTKYHWHVAGACTYPLEGNGQGDSRVNGPEDGDGYVWMEDNYYLSPTGRKCLMTYPIFTSNYSGIIIDLKNGAWKDGKYIDKKVKLINFSCLNHHGYSFGVTASVKNLMGVVDMTCGYPGDQPLDSYNTHHIGVSKLKHWLYYRAHWRIKNSNNTLKHKFVAYIYKNCHHTGGVLGHFMVNVRMPELHIIASEIVGWGGRKDPKKAFHSNSVLASKDPVALDYIAAKYILLPNTPKDVKAGNGIPLSELHDPDNKDGKFRKFLEETQRQGVGTLDENRIEVIRIV